MKKSGESLSLKEKALLDSGMSKEEAAKELFFDAVTVSLMQKWRSIHLPIALMFGILSMLHIITITLFGK